ncbi:hypothetical protein J7E97_06605, partial [Streptomyces sp. ISL-66]|nr:hypothetical protein [Streptomyces sp. ISL-66]
MPGSGTFREDFGASVVVALVAPPLCVAAAVASGVPAELAGTGLVLIAGQVYALADAQAPAGTLGKLAGAAGLGGRADWTAVALGAGTIAVLAAWRRMPDRLRLAPGALVG